MPSSAEDLCRHLASAFAEGRLDRFSDCYIYPLAVYLPDGIRIEMTPKETADAVFARRTAALKAGMRSVSVRIADVTELEGGRIAISLSWDFLDEKETSRGRSSMIYYCRRCEDGEMRVEMIEFTEVAFAGTPSASSFRSQGT